MAARAGRADDECWPWPGALHSNGYGRVSLGRTSYGAHRLAYSTFVAPVPDDMQIDHLCHTRDVECRAGVGCPHRRCVNYLNHMEVVTLQENWRRSGSPTRIHALKECCPCGRDYDTVRVNRCGGLARICSHCRRVRERERGRSAVHSTADQVAAVLNDDRTALEVILDRLAFVWPERYTGWTRRNLSWALRTRGVEVSSMWLPGLDGTRANRFGVTRTQLVEVLS